MSEVEGRPQIPFGHGPQRPLDDDEARVDEGQRVWSKEQFGRWVTSPGGGPHPAVPPGIETETLLKDVFDTAMALGERCEEMEEELSDDP